MPSKVSATHAQLVALSRLTPAGWNPRKIAPERFDNLCKSMQADPDFLRLRPILAMVDGTIYAGNMRYHAAKHLGMAEVWAIVEDVPEQLAKERALRDNAGWGENVDDQVGELLAELKASGSDIDLLGFESAELDRLLGAVTQLPEEDSEADLAPPADPITKPGDLWLLGEHRLLCGDSTVATDVVRLLDGATPILMVTDPPYGVEYDAEWRNDRAAKGQLGYAARRTQAVEHDDRADWSEAWSLSPSDVVYCWHAGLTSLLAGRSLEQAGFEIRAQIVWAKSNYPISRGHYHWRHEACWYAVRVGATASWIGDHAQTTLWQINLDANVEGGHSTQKPLECMERPIRNHSGEVYEPFAGSGTTLIAAERLSRRCYAMEISPAYCDVICNRWAKLTGKTPVLETAALSVAA